MNSLQDQMDSLNSRIQEERNAGMQDTHPTMIELQQAKKDLQSKIDNQATETRVTEHVAANGYILDTLTTSNGMTMAELSYSPENHELVCIAVQKAFLAQQDAFEKKIADVQFSIENISTELKNQLDAKDKLNDQLYTAVFEKNDADQKRDNAVKLAEELQAKLDQQTKDAVAIAPLSAEEQETKLINELNGKQIKVVNMKPKSDAFNEKMFTATNVLTGVEFEDYFLYIKRYEEITADQAAQLQAAYAQKKADIEASNNIPELKQIDEEPAAVTTPQETVQTSTPRLDGNESSGEVVGAEAQDALTESEKIGNIAVGDIAQLHHALFELAQSHESLVAKVAVLEDRLSPPSNAAGQAAA